MKQLATWTVAIAALAALTWAGSPQAHHSGSMYETTPIWVKGRVVRFEGANPHTITTLEERSEDGQVRRWAVEGPGQSQLDRVGIGMDVPTIGDIIDFCAFAYKPAAELSRMFPGVDFSVRRWSAATDGSSPQFVAGHVMVMPDGQKRLWEPHGLISECIRSSDDQRQSWLDFLNSNPSVRQAWCEQRGYTHIQSTASLREFVEEVNRLIDNPCG
jgi:Family of unknown function (DUF6152)